MCDDPSDQRFQTGAFALLHFIIEQRLSINRLCVVDSTALTRGARMSVLDLARKYRVPCMALLFDVPLETCVTRDRLRERSVGRTVIKRHCELFEETKANINQEGFDEVIKMTQKEMDNVRIEVLFRPAPRRSERQRRAPRAVSGRMADRDLPRGLPSSFRKGDFKSGTPIGFEAAAAEAPEPSGIPSDRRELPKPSQPRIRY